MISAPVGFQCPDCVRSAQRASKPLLMPSSGTGIPNVTRYLIGACSVIYALTVFGGGINQIAQTWGMWPRAVAAGEWWRLLSCTLLHASIWHILFNMYALLVLGSQLERILGPIRFAAIYAVAALGGSVASYWFAPVDSLSVGASGAVFGLMTGLIVLGKRRNADVSQIIFWFGINIVFSFLASGIDWRAHLGGAAFGAAVTAIVVPRDRRRGLQEQALGILALVILLVIVVVIRDHQIVTALP